MENPPRVAVLIPCLNEATTVARVICDFRRALPNAEIVVYDNDSSDDTAPTARRVGARVVIEPRRGKGFVVQRMLETSSAEICLMVDGDATYSAAAAKLMTDLVAAGRADMVVGARLALHSPGAFRPIHLLGNRLVRWSLNALFGAGLTDVLSGYRAFNRRVACMIPLTAGGFEIETELTANCLRYGLKVAEVQVPYGQRPQNSTSKIRTLRDGVRIIWTLLGLVQAHRPMAFFAAIASLFFLAGAAVGIPPIRDFVESDFTEVRRFPSALLATGLMIIAAINLLAGVLLHGIYGRLREVHSVVTRTWAPERVAAAERPLGRSVGPP
jgi:glycosyltransferase involved in cell wall biosynthesis